MKISLKHLLTGLAIAITPTHKLADQGPKIDLETMIPKQFGEWTNGLAAVPNALGWTGFNLIADGVKLKQVRRGY
jgi:hypothetical protein